MDMTPLSGAVVEPRRPRRAGCGLMKRGFKRGAEIFSGTKSCG